MEFLDPQQLMKMSPPALLVLGLLVIGAVLKRIGSPLVDRLIAPTLTLAGGAIYPFIADVSKVDYTMSNPQVFLVLCGLIIGAGSVGLNQNWRQLTAPKQEPPPSDTNKQPRNP